MPGLARALPWLAVLGFTLPLYPARGADKPQVPSEVLQSLKKEMQQVSDDRNRRMEAAKTPAAEQQVWQDHRARRDAIASKAVELARQNPKDPVALEALDWVIAGGIGWGPPTDAAFDLLTADHLASDKLEQVCRMASIYNLSKASERFLRAVLEKSPHRSMRGVACLCLARRLQYDAEGARYQKRPGADRLQKEAEDYYERALAEYADVVMSKQPIGERARNALFEIRNLVIGKRAPDVTGEDIDGKKFKLSDYRGKVVILDFWGHW
jgi:hypothetical protein